ncbi:MAG: hypothetical protein AVDCRST_MAG83-2831, partial [uncultured Arthrobacter sp.]
DRESVRTADRLHGLARQPARRREPAHRRRDDHPAAAGRRRCRVDDGRRLGNAPGRASPARAVRRPAPRLLRTGGTLRPPTARAAHGVAAATRHRRGLARRHLRPRGST